MAENQSAAHDGLLVCEHVNAGWGDTQVLSDISFSLPAGETLAILGRNGVGKSTLLSTIVGRATLKSGDIRHAGKSLAKVPKYLRARGGIGLVPQEREVFRSLTVQENLKVAEAGEGWDIDRVYELFPRLKERRTNRGDQLSGGEQQMLSIARALMGNPSVILLDEPMEGLAPVIVEQLIKAVHRIRAETKLAILLVEQHATIALEFTTRVMVLDRGMVVYDNADGAKTTELADIERLIGIDAA
jgi:branched-chain amino acid transport system ATP-binding protein